MAGPATGEPLRHHAANTKFALILYYTWESVFSKLFSTIFAERIKPLKNRLFRTKKLLVYCAGSKVWRARPRVWRPKPLVPSAKPRVCPAKPLVGAIK